MSLQTNTATTKFDFIMQMLKKKEKSSMQCSQDTVKKKVINFQI